MPPVSDHATIFRDVELAGGTLYVSGGRETVSGLFVALLFLEGTITRLRIQVQELVSLPKESKVAFFHVSSGWAYSIPLMQVRHRTHWSCSRVMAVTDCFCRGWFVAGILQGPYLIGSRERTAGM